MTSVHTARAHAERRSAGVDVGAGVGVDPGGRQQRADAARAESRKGPS